MPSTRLHQPTFRSVYYCVLPPDVIQRVLLKSRTRRFWPEACLKHLEPGIGSQRFKPRVRIFSDCPLISLSPANPSPSCSHPVERWHQRQGCRGTKRGAFQRPARNDHRGDPPGLQRERLRLTLQPIFQRGSFAERPLSGDDWWKCRTGRDSRRDPWWRKGSCNRCHDWRRSGNRRSSRESSSGGTASVGIYAQLQASGCPNSDTCFHSAARQECRSGFLLLRFLFRR